MARRREDISEVIARSEYAHHGVLARAVQACLLAAVVVAALALPAAASAAPPASGEVGSESVFTYSDLKDANPKYSGGYASFDTTAGLYTTSPHGGYDTASNKCSTCHAVHRSSGSYELLRSTSLSDACFYCHIGGSAHSAKVVYDANADGTGTSVGHAMGGLTSIPLSAVSVTLSTTDIASTDASGNVTTTTVPIREVGAENRMYRLRRNHTQNEPGNYTSGYQRVGPYALTCLSCHQPHNAPSEAWRPMEFPSRDATLGGGYKLLRASPSGSIYGPDDMPYGAGGPPTVSYSKDGMVGFKSYTDFATTGLVNADAVIRAVEATISPATVGPGKTIWDTPSFGGSVGASPTTPAEERSPTGVDQYALSVWCADCHNLSVGRYDEAYANLDSSAHAATKTHAAPMVGAFNGPGQCYTCHRGGLSADPTEATYEPDQTACERCHYGTGAYALDPARATGDFPHSAETSGAYMLGAWTVDADGAIEPTVVTAANAQVIVCRRCHPTSGRAHDPVAP